MYLKKIINKFYFNYLNLFHKTMKLEKNSMLDYRCEIDCKKNIYIGKKSIVYKHVTIYKNEEAIFSVGESSHIAPYGYFLLGNHTVRIGNNVAIAKNCSFFCISNSIPKDKLILFKDSYHKGDIQIGSNVFIGANCVVLPETIIEDNVVIAANSTLKGHLENGYLYAGNPIKKIKKVFE